MPVNQPFVSCKNALKSVIIHPGRSFIQSGVCVLKVVSLGCFSIADVDIEAGLKELFINSVKFVMAVNLSTISVLVRLKHVSITDVGIKVPLKSNSVSSRCPSGRVSSEGKYKKCCKFCQLCQSVISDRRSDP